MVLLADLFGLRPSGCTSCDDHGQIDRVRPHRSTTKINDKNAHKRERKARRQRLEKKGEAQV